MIEDKVIFLWPKFETLSKHNLHRKKEDNIHIEYSLKKDKIE
jgi:hypothetical protein